MSRKPTPPHLLRVARTVLQFAQLVAALRQDGRRVGYLEWSPVARSEGFPALFPEAGAAGVARAVRVDAEQTVSIKPRRGAPVLRDVLREHFRGHAVVLVHGEFAAHEIDAPLLEPLLRDSTPAGWRIIWPDGKAREMTSEELVAALRRPRPFAKEIP